MKSTSIFLLASATVLFFACNSSKKMQSTTATAPKVSNGVPTPYQAQVDAIQTKYKDVTLQTLTSGHAIYVGACTNCHRAKNINKFTEENWTKIMNRMTPKAKLTEAEKDQVTKYVMAVKATSPAPVTK